MHPDTPEREIPSRWQSATFFAKTRIFQLRRSLTEWSSRPRRHPRGISLLDAPATAEKRTSLWNKLGPGEFPLTAGKVENLRVAARSFHGVEVPADATFSFWSQLGRIRRSQGFRVGRELREGCLVPSIGGGLCQLSGLLYQAALDSGMEIIERHAHSRRISGSAAELDLDATVYWNYVDLRFRSKVPFRVEVELTTSELVVRIRSGGTFPKEMPAHVSGPDTRAPASGDCQTCGMTACFRHPTAISSASPSMGHSAFLLDSRWPEFDRWCAGHSQSGDWWFTPMDGLRWKRPNYQWGPPDSAQIHHATRIALIRSFRQRRLPAQGAMRQETLLDSDAALARHYASKLDPQCRHLVISQNLLPHLWLAGTLGGRSFDVLVERWPMEELQRILDRAKTANPQSTTLADFRADPTLVRAEREALAAAGRLITPHRTIASHFGNRAWLLDWESPRPLERRETSSPVLFLPASRLGRKGAFELAAAMRSGIPVHLAHLGSAGEGAADPFVGLACSKATVSELSSASILVLPAWVEHQPRLALLALASGIPVIATQACGLPAHDLLWEIASPRADALAAAIHDVLQSAPRSCVA